MLENDAKKAASLSYKILYHGNGYIRLEVPSLRKLAWSLFFSTFKSAFPFALPSAIKRFDANPLTGNIIIAYDPNDIDILDFIEKMAGDPEILKIVKGQPR